MSDEILLSPIVDTLHQLALKSRKASDQDLQNLHQMAESLMPKFVEAMEEHKVRKNSKMYDTSLLSRLRFSLAEMCCLLSVSAQSMTTMRMSLYKKVSGKEGHAHDFDEIILQIPC